MLCESPFCIVSSTLDAIVSLIDDLDVRINVDACTLRERRDVRKHESLITDTADTFNRSNILSPLEVRDKMATLPSDIRILRQTRTNNKYRYTCALLDSSLVSDIPPHTFPTSAIHAIRDTHHLLRTQTVRKCGHPCKRAGADRGTDVSQSLEGGTSTVATGMSETNKTANNTSTPETKDNEGEHKNQRFIVGFGQPV